MAVSRAHFLQAHQLLRSENALGVPDERARGLFNNNYSSVWTAGSRSIGVSQSYSFKSFNGHHSRCSRKGGYVPYFGPFNAKRKHPCGRIGRSDGLGFMGFWDFKASLSDGNVMALTDRPMLVGWRNRQYTLGELCFCKAASIDEANRVAGRTIRRGRKHQACRRKVRAFLASTVGDSEDGASICISEVSENSEEEGPQTPFSGWRPPRYLWRALAALVIAGQVITRSFQGRIHWKNSLQQLEQAGPRSVGVCLLTAAFVGMAFTIQFVREFTRLGLNRSVGGVLALAFSRELSPVVTSIIIAGRVGSAFAAELGTMQVSEQTDTLRVLGTDPVDYLVTPRVIACCVALPILTLLCFTVGMAASALLADAVYQVSANIILDSAKRALQPWDLISAMVKSTVFGGLISVISCTWGVTTLGGARGVGESTTSAVVISLVCIFIADFILSWCFFQGAGDALKSAMG